MLWASGNTANIIINRRVTYWLQTRFYAIMLEKIEIRSANTFVDL